MMSGEAKLTPAVFTNMGTVIPRTAKATNPLIMAGTVDDERVPSDEMQLAKHGDMPSPPAWKDSHHGMMSQWMSVHFAGYDPNQAPAVLMATESHRATFGGFAAQRRAMGGVFDWTKVSETDMLQLSDDMFNAAGVSETMRQEYWAWYARMKNELRQ